MSSAWLSRTPVCLTMLDGGHQWQHWSPNAVDFNTIRPQATTYAFSLDSSLALCLSMLILYNLQNEQSAQQVACCLGTIFRTTMCVWNTTGPSAHL